MNIIIFGKELEQRTLRFIVFGFIGTIILAVFGYFYIQKKFTVIPEEVTMEMMRERMINRQLDGIEKMRQIVENGQERTAKTIEEQLDGLDARRKKSGIKPLTETEVQAQLDALDKLRTEI